MGRDACGLGPDSLRRLLARRVVLPMDGGAALHHAAELRGRLRQDLAVALIDDHAVTPDGIQQVDLSGAIARRHRLRVFRQPGLAVGADCLPLPFGRFGVDRELQVAGVDGVDHHAVVLTGALD